MKTATISVLAATAFAAAFDFQIGGRTNQQTGIYLDCRWPIHSFFAGFGASENFVDVATYKTVHKYTTDSRGQPTYSHDEYVKNPSQAAAVLHALELFAGYQFLTSETHQLQVSSGIGWALLDGTEDGQPDRSRDMLTVPVRLEGIWTPGVWSRFPGLGLAAGTGIEWRSGINKPQLYRETSEFVVTARLGLHL